MLSLILKLQSSKFSILSQSLNFNVEEASTSLHECETFYLVHFYQELVLIFNLIAVIMTGIKLSTMRSNSEILYDLISTLKSHRKRITLAYSTSSDTIIQFPNKYFKAQFHNLVF